MTKTKEACYKSFVNVTYFGGDDELLEKIRLFDCEED